MKNLKSIRLGNVKLIPLIVLCTVILVFPLILREYRKDPLVEDVSYYHARIAQQISSDFGLPRKDALLYSNRIFPLIPALPLLLALPNLIFRIPIMTLSKILPILVGILSFLLFFLLLKELKINKKIMNISLLLLVISPPFIYIFTTLNDHLIPIFLVLLSFLLFLRNKKFLSAILFLLIPLFSISDSFIGLFFFFIYIVSTKRKFRTFFFLLLSVLIISLLQYLPFVILYGFPEIPAFKISEEGINFAFQNFISDFGGKFGIGLFSILLGFSGLAVVWRKKYKNLLVYTLCVALVVISFYLAWLIIYLNFLLVILASIGLIYLIKIKWESKLIKNFIIFILICGIIISGVSHIDRISKLSPSKMMFDSLKILKEKSKPNEIVFSHYSNGFWINGIADRPVIMDRYFIYTPNVNQLHKDSQNIFYSINLEDTTKLLDKYKVKYIWIDKKMKESQVWKREEEGLLFLLKYSRKFENIHSDEETEIWKVKENL